MKFIGPIQPTPEQAGMMVGEQLAVMAIRLCRKGLPVEIWCEFFPGYVGKLAGTYPDPADLEAWQAALLSSYQNILHNHIDDVLLMIDEPEGRA
jgi:hypothetical protein